MRAVNTTMRRDDLARAASGLDPKGVAAISEALNVLLADFFAIYVKTKNFHWHISGPHFRDYHLLLDDQGAQILAATDPIAERVRKIGGTTLHSIGHIDRLKRLRDNDNETIGAREMLTELLADNQSLVASLRDVHVVCDEYNDVATASPIENWIDETEQRVWFLAEAIA
jgi:starvation-inducible DNA-binding protein